MQRQNNHYNNCYQVSDLTTSLSYIKIFPEHDSFSISQLSDHKSYLAVILSVPDKLEVIRFLLLFGLKPEIRMGDVSYIYMHQGKVTVLDSVLPRISFSHPGVLLNHPFSGFL